MSFPRHPWQIADKGSPRPATAGFSHGQRRSIFALLQLLVACWIQVTAQTGWAGCVTTPDNPSWMHGEATQVNSEALTATIRAIRLRVTLETDDTQLRTDDVSSWLFVAVGPMALPAALANPFAIFGVLFPVVGPPVNSVFRSKREAIVRALCNESLPAGVLAALGDRLREAPLPNLKSIDVRIAVYGLSPTSGKAPRVFADDVRMCLVASFSVAAGMGNRDLEWPSMGIGIYSRSGDEPPPICASFGRFAADDGRYLRQAIQETAEIVAAMVITRLEAEP